MKRARIYFILFVLSVGLQKADYLTSLFIGFEITKLLGGSLLVLPPLFLLLCYRNIKSSKPLTISTVKLKSRIKFFAVVVLILALYGSLRGNLTYFIFTELWIYMIVILSMFLSVYDEIWELFEKELVVVFWLFFMMVLIGKNYERKYLFEAGISMDTIDRSQTATMAYEISPILDFWPIVFVLSYLKSKKDIWKILGISSFIIYTGLQIYFLKRAPSVRALSYFLLITILANYVYKKKNLPQVIFIFVLMIISFSLISVEGLLVRFESDDMARIMEAKIMLLQMSPIDYVIGKGLGGYFLVNDLYAPGTLIVNSRGQTGKTIMHIGMFYPLLKGGVMFIIAHAVLVFPVFKRLGDTKWLKDPHNITAVTVLMVYAVFRFIEGPFSTGAVFDGMIFGLCSGRLLYQSKNINEKEYIR